MIIDTGSPLMWVQGTNCVKCTYDKNKYDVSASKYAHYIHD